MTSRITVMIGILIALVCFALPVQAQLVDDEVRSGHIKEADGTTGQDTATGSGIKTGHIQDNAVTTPKISGNAITTSKIKNGAITPDKVGFYSRVIIVDKNGGGDFTSPVAAMDAIVDASSTNPYLVKIMPGRYNIGASSVQMKAYVDIEGSGEKTTIIIGAVYNGIVKGSNNAEIRFLTIKSTGSGNGNISAAISNDNASPSIAHVTATASGADYNYAINNYNSSAPRLTEVTAIATGGHSNGIFISSSAEPVMSNVTATGAGATEGHGIYIMNSSPLLTNVVATASGGESPSGIFNYNSSTTLRNVTATATGATNAYGIYNYQSSLVLSDVNASGTGGIQWCYGLYNRADAGAYNVQIDRSTLEGIVYSIVSNSQYTVYIGASKLAGGKSGTGYHCAGTYNASYVLLSATCD